jgi:hypothetical protein
MEPRPPEPPKEPSSGLPKWFKAAAIVHGVTAGVIILVGGACFLILTSLALG